MSDEVFAVCAVDALAVGEARRFDVGEHRIALVRGEDCWFAVGDECTHADYSLADGEVDLEECTLECFKHGSLFSLMTGVPETLPATQPVAVYEVVVGETEVSIRIPATEGASS